jgi:hypothetical protein
MDMTGWLEYFTEGLGAQMRDVQTALELASVRSKTAAQNSEVECAKFVSDAEEAFSREHTLWKASRGFGSI